MDTLLCFKKRDVTPLKRVRFLFLCSFKSIKYLFTNTLYPYSYGQENVVICLKSARYKANASGEMSGLITKLIKKQYI